MKKFQIWILKLFENECSWVKVRREREREKGKRDNEIIEGRKVSYKDETQIILGERKITSKVKCLIVGFFDLNSYSSLLSY